MPLTVGVLSMSAKVGSTRRLIETLRARKHKARVLLPQDLRIYVADGNPELLHKEKPLKALDAIVPRIGSSNTFFGTALVAQFEQMGVFCLNTAQAINVSRNKLRAIQRLSRHGIGLPETVFLSAKGDVATALDLVGGVPVIIKLLEGTQGIGVMLAESEESATSIMETMRKTGQDALVQRFVAESRGRDVRALVVGGQVIAAVRRVAQGSEFRSNVHRGSKAEKIELEPAYAKTAAQAAQILGLDVAGVDMLESASGPMVVEVNSSPSLAGMEESTGLDLTTPVVELLEDRVHLPPANAAQRLTTLRQGFGVSEVPVPADSHLSGKSLGEAVSREEGLQVLCVQRGEEVLTSPRDDFVVQPEDVLVVFGPLTGIADLRPKRRRRRPAGEGSQGSSASSSK